MEIKRFEILHILLFILVLNGITSKLAFSQATGSLYMFQDNFYSQILNASYLRNDKALEIAIPGLAGATLGNSGNFKISDLIVKGPAGSMVLDIENFYNAGNAKSSIKDWLSLPLVYIAFPVGDGRISIYLKENVQSALDFNISALEFFDNGNLPPDFRSYNTDNISYSGIEYRELAVGYARNINDKINVGVRGKILFGTVYAEVENWNYWINTSESGDAVELTSSGLGRLSLPFPLELDIENRILRVVGDNALGKYLSTFSNPGLAIDLGATIHLNKQSWLSVSANDLGGIWFRQNAMNIKQDASYIFRGFDISNSIDSQRGMGYIDPFYLMLETKDSIRNVYRPVVDTARFLQGLVPKTAFHYQYTFSNFLSLGVTNQSAFYKNSILNIFTVSTLQKAGNLSVFENVNLYGLNTITVGGGFQWEGKFLQVFAATDNLFSVYHPARNKSFSMSVGISILLNKPDEKKISRGNFSTYLPFYDNKN